MTEQEAITVFEEILAIDYRDTIPKYYEAMELAVKDMKEVKKYRTIGTPEECRAAVDKQKAKKPIMKQYFEDLEDEYLCCPTCGEILTDRIPADNKTFYFHCMNCGQKFDWSDEE